MKKISLLISICLMSLSIFSQTETTDKIDNLPNNLNEDSLAKQDLPDRMPRFPACEHLELNDIEKEKCGRKKLLEFIYSELKYPPKALKRKKTGTVVIGFTVTESGKIENIKLLRDIGKGCGEEALRVIKKMGNLEENWISGIQYGNKVPVRFTLPIKFSPETILN